MKLSTTFSEDAAEVGVIFIVSKDWKNTNSLTKLLVPPSFNLFGYETDLTVMSLYSELGLDHE